jgi:hypothetical protein
MSETNDLVAVEPAPEPEVTATPVADAALEAKPEEVPAPKTFTQEELDAAVGKRLARERRKWEREMAAKAPEAPKADAPLPPKEEDPEGYAEALAERKAAELLAKREAEREAQERLSAYQDREEQARDKYDDFESVVYNPQLRITNVMAETIQASDVGPDVAYYLGTNPKEAERIARLSPFLQAKEIGRIEAKLAAEPIQTRKTTAAPPPIRPVTARASGAPAKDTTDPRSIKDMSTSEWIEAERQRQIRLWEQRNR